MAEAAGLRDAILDDMEKLLQEHLWDAEVIAQMASAAYHLNMIAAANAALDHQQTMIDKAFK